MSYNQSLIKDLRFETVAKAQSRDSRGKQAFIVEKGLWYHGVTVANGTADGIADDDLYIATPVTDVFWKKQEGGEGGGAPLPATGEAGAPADSTPSSIAPTVTFADVQGKTAAEALMALHFPATVPTQTLPTVTLGLLPITIAKGSALPGNLTSNFVQNNGGAKNGDYNLVVSDSGGELFNANASDGAFDISAVVELQSLQETATFTLSVDYDAGLVPNDSYGNPSPSDQVAAGTASIVLTVTPTLSIHHGLQAKGEDLTAKTSTELRTIANALTAAADGTAVFTNVTIPNTSDYYFLIPGVKTTVTTVSQGFTITGIASVLGQVTMDDAAGTESSTYTLIKLAGQAAQSVIDTVTIS
ncbi:hypothetical protein SM033_00300 [Vibrio phage vB_VpaM_sm033]|nr:hypothetical protein SM033_00300 [Vibrio phage vB_VpaM_sm033]